MLLRFAKDRQIVISTHSPYFVDVSSFGFGAHLARVVATDRGTKIHQLSQDAKNIIHKLATNNIYNPHVFGLDARELFFLDENIILTEGQEDVLLFPRIFSQLGVHVPGTFFGWGAGGASNIIKICHILKDLGFSNVSAIFDGDKAIEAAKCRESYPDYFFACIPAKDIRTKEARKATDEIDGVLDQNYVIRPEHEEAMRNFAEKLAKQDSTQVDKKS